LKNKLQEGYQKGLIKQAFPYTGGTIELILPMAVENCR